MMRSDSLFDGGVALIHQQEGRSNMEAKDGRGTRESRVLLACLIVSCALVCDAGKAVPPPKPEYVAPSFQSASVQPSLLQDYDVPKSLSIGVTVKGKPSVFLSLIQRPLGGIKGLIQATAKPSNRNLTISSTIDDKGNIEAIVTDKDSVTKGLVFKVKGHNKGKDLTDFAADIAADYTFSKSVGPGGFTGRVGVKNSHLTMSGVLGHGAGLVGVFTEFDAEAGTLTEPALLASYTGSSFSLTANGKAGGGNARLSFEQRVTSSISIAAGLFCTGNYFLKDNAVTLAAQNEFAGGHKLRCKLDSATQTASVHAAIKDGIPYSVIHASAKVDRGGQTKFGLSAKFTPPLSI